MLLFGRGMTLKPDTAGAGCEAADAAAAAGEGGEANEAKAGDCTPSFAGNWDVLGPALKGVAAVVGMVDIDPGAGALTAAK
mmetsp:Transcript_21693/g.35784  ORF Transcript_21693/g.35784 Transcript_21693/m.35784 type:complete len:81 (-) Transcript_21693:652-894(-)